MLLHGSCVALDGAGLLLLGAPGSGKSSLALRLMERGWTLVADDQVRLAADTALIGDAPGPLAGRLEIRGLGLFEAVPHAPARLAAVARLLPLAAMPRLPQAARFAALGLELPEFPLAAADPAAPEKAAWALAAALGQRRQSAGAFAP